MAEHITSLATAGSGLKARTAKAVKSADFDNVYFIAVKVGISGVDDQVGVWASNSLTAGDGAVMAVDGIAKQFTTWPDADTTTAAISAADPSVSAATACL